MVALQCIYLEALSALVYIMMTCYVITKYLFTLIKKFKRLHVYSKLGISLEIEFLQ